VTVVESSAAPPRSSSVYARLPSRPQPSASQHVGTVSRYALIALLALAMGVQNATARRLAVAELTPTVLMQTLTGIAAGSWLIAAGLLTLVTSPLTTGGPDRKESHDRR